MKTRPHLLITHVILLALVGHSLGGRSAWAEESQTPEQAQPPGSLFELFRSKARSGEPLPSKQGHPLGRLFTRWPTRRPADSSAAPQQPSNLGTSIPAAWEHEAKHAGDGDFPSFRFNAQHTDQVNPSPAPTTVLTSHEAPDSNESVPTTVTLRPDKEVARPLPAVPAPSRSTTAYLADPVRFGHVFRRPPAAPKIERAIDPPAAEELRDVKPSPTPTAREALSTGSATASPQTLPLEPDDVSALRDPWPYAAAHFNAPASDHDRSSAPARVSSAASPAALQQALREFGAVIALTDKNEAALLSESPEPALRPAGNDNSSREAREHQVAGQRCEGEVKAVDRRNGTVQITFFDGCLPEVGSRVRVFQRVLFKTALLGQFEVIGINGKTVIAEPLGKIDLEQIFPGDEAVAF